MEPIELYDTTLRDGTQGENINFTAAEKLAVAQRLDDLGIPYVEGGWPGANPRDVEFFRLVQRHRFHQTRIAAFGATRRPDKAADKDPNLKALIRSGADVTTVFGKTWDLHAGLIGASLDQNIAMIAESVAFLKHAGKEVIYDAEHFFDGFTANPDYAVQTVAAAIQAGADAVVLCDTNGGTLPHDIEKAIADLNVLLAKRFVWKAGLWPVRLGIHTHNDCGLAVANTIAAVRAGVTLVQGTINGYGERCGNADLTSVIPILALKMGRNCLEPDKLRQLKTVSRFVNETANLVPNNARPFVGRSAFAHKGGIHVSAILKEPRAYEHIDPERVGNSRRVLVSDMAGKSNIEYKAREMGVTLGGNGFDSRRIADQIKQLEEQGYQFDTADGSLKILMEKFTDQFRPVFELESFRVIIEKDKDKPCAAQATIKIAVDGKTEITAAEGSGPVSALDNALRKALDQFFPGLETMRLVDFKVRVMDGRAGTAAKVRVLIQSRDSDDIWNTVGVSTDIIEASWQALADSFQYKLAAAVKPENLKEEKAAAV